jgi:hypothetical protein
MPPLPSRDSTPGAEHALRDKPQEHGPDDEVDSDKLFGPFLSW